MKEFYKKIYYKIDQLKKANQEAMNKGDLHTYQCNCNVLKGIKLTLFFLKRYEK